MQPSFRTCSFFSFSIALYLLAFVLTGCSLGVKNACGLNRSLTYVGWADPDACKESCPSPQGLVAEAERSVHVLPGMRVTLNTTSLTLQGQNILMPRISRFEWVVPKEKFTPDDYFVIGYLIATASHDVNDITVLKNIGDGVSDANFHRGIDKDLYRPLVTSMRWFPATRLSGRLCATAALLRESVSEPLRKDFTDPQAGTPQLVFSIGDTRFQYGGGSAAYANADVPPEVIDPPSPWLDPATPIGGRVLASIDIPVRFQGEAVSRFVPVYTSVGDLERRLGVPINGVRRDRAFFDAIEITGKRWGDPKQTVISDDGYFTIWFGRWHGWARDEKNLSLVTRGIRKDDILLAAGDVILLDRHRLRATDEPGVR